MNTRNVAIRRVLAKLLVPQFRAIQFFKLGKVHVMLARRASEDFSGVSLAGASG